MEKRIVVDKSVSSLLVSSMLLLHSVQIQYRNGEMVLLGGHQPSVHCVKESVQLIGPTCSHVLLALVL